MNELIVIEDKVTEEASFCYSKELCSSVTMSFDYSVYKQLLFICYYVFRLFCLQAIRVHLLLCLHNYLVFISNSCSSVTMSFIYPVYSQVASCLNKGIYIYIIRRQKSVKFNYFSNLPICRRYANSLNRRKLLICRTTSQSIDLHMITKEQNQAI